MPQSPKPKLSSLKAEAAVSPRCGATTFGSCNHYIHQESVQFKLSTQSGIGPPLPLGAEASKNSLETSLHYRLSLGQNGRGFSSPLPRLSWHACIQKKNCPQGRIPNSFILGVGLFPKKWGCISCGRAVCGCGCGCVGGWVGLQHHPMRCPVKGFLTHLPLATLV